MDAAAVIVSLEQASAYVRDGIQDLPEARQRAGYDDAYEAALRVADSRDCSTSATAAVGRFQVAAMSVAAYAEPYLDEASDLFTLASRHRRSDDAELSAAANDAYQFANDAPASFASDAYLAARLSLRSQACS